MRLTTQIKVLLYDRQARREGKNERENRERLSMATHTHSLFLLHCSNMSTTTPENWIYKCILCLRHLHAVYVLMDLEEWRRERERERERERGRREGERRCNLWLQFLILHGKAILFHSASRSLRFHLIFLSLWTATVVKHTHTHTRNIWWQKVAHRQTGLQTAHMR